jgi:hypothetical protein
MYGVGIVQCPAKHRIYSVCFFNCFRCCNTTISYLTQERYYKQAYTTKFTLREYTISQYMQTSCYNPLQVHPMLVENDMPHIRVCNIVSVFLFM